jgi:hypothetical protein
MAQPQSSIPLNSSTTVQINETSTYKIPVPSTPYPPPSPPQAPGPVPTDPKDHKDLKDLKDVDRIRFKLRPALLYVVSTAQFFDIGNKKTFFPHHFPWCALTIT